MNTPIEPHDPYAPSNGVRERWTFTGAIVGVLSIIGALYFIFATVEPLALALIAVLVALLCFVVYRVTRSATRDHDAEVVQAGMAGMQTALQIMREQYRISAPSIYQSPPLPEAEMPRPPRCIDPPGDVWMSQGAGNYTRTDAREVPVVDHNDDVLLQMQAGDEQRIPLAKLNAFVKCYPKITQDEFLAAGGGAPTLYREYGEMLCDCEPPFLLRKADGRGGYTFAGRHWHDVDKWLAAHDVNVRAHTR